jgi:hypothetical protein
MYTPRYDYENNFEELTLHLEDEFKDKPPCDLVDLIIAMRIDLLEYFEAETNERDPYAKTKNLLLRIADLDFHIRAVWQFFCNNYFSFLKIPNFIITKARIKTHMGLWATELNKCRDFLYRVFHGLHLRDRDKISQFLKDNSSDEINAIIREYLELFDLDLKEPDPEDEI